MNIINEQTIIGALAGALVAVAGVLYKQWQKSQRRDDKHNEQVQANLIKYAQMLGSVKLSYERLDNQIKEVCQKLQHHLEMQDKNTDDIINICLSIQEEIEITKYKLDKNGNFNGKN